MIQFESVYCSPFCFSFFCDPVSLLYIEEHEALLQSGAWLFLDEKSDCV